jgi:hypothetical protein
VMGDRWDDGMAGIGWDHRRSVVDSRCDALFLVGG